MEEVIEILRNLTTEIYKKIDGLAGSEEAKKIIGKGRFGDNTVFIDKLSEDIILDGLNRKVGSCSVLTEERGEIDFGGKYPLFIVDPIDGSLNAKRGIPYYSISIAVAFGEGISDIKCGYVVNLANKDEFWAISGKGAFFNGSRIRPQLKGIRVIAVEGLKREVNDDVLIRIFRNFYRVRQVGSTALDMCYTALGAYDAFLHLDEARIIDYAAAKVIIEEAGGGLFKWINENSYGGKISLHKGDRFVAVPDKGYIKKLMELFYA